MMPRADKPVADTPIRDSLDRALSAIAVQLPADRGGFLQVDADIASRGLRAQIGHRFSRTWAASGWAGLAAGQRYEAGIRLHGTW